MIEAQNVKEIKKILVMDEKYRNIVKWKEMREFKNKTRDQGGVRESEKRRIKKNREK